MKTCRTAAVVLGIVLVVVAWPAAASAQRGVAVDVGRIDIDDVLRSGERYTLPAIGVRNPGTEDGRYAMVVSPIQSDRAQVPASWVTFTPSTLRLEPDEKASVEPILQIPRGAAPGEYETLIAAQLTGSGDGAEVGAAAATRLTFAVAAGPPPDAGGIRPGWLLLLLVIVVLVAVLKRLKGFRIRIERA